MADEPSPSDASDFATLIGRVADEFMLRWRRGETPDLGEYARRYPEIAEVLWQMLPALGALAEHGPSGDDRTARLEGSPYLVEVESPTGYSIVEELGRGGMGVVYRARQLELQRDVALKMLRGDWVSEDQVERFRSEALAFGQLQHPNVVRIFDVGQQSGRPFLVLELVEGGTLADHLGRQPQPFEESAELVETLARAASTVHERGLVHRDIKPSNVLLARDEVSGVVVPKITDFGLVKFTDPKENGDLTQTGAIVGTPAYLAPEQASATVGEVGPSADVYALGAILFEMIAGRPPFEGASSLETLIQVRDREAVAPRLLRPDCPVDLETICLMCLRKEPARRYLSAAELADDLRRFLDGEPIRARPVGWVERCSKWCRRNRALAGALALAVLILVVGSVVSTWFGLQATESAKQADVARGLEAGERRKAESAAQQAEAAREKEARQRHRAEMLYYSSRLESALSAWQIDRDAPLALERLDATRWDHRGWEHDFLYTLFTRNNHTFEGHEGVVSDLRFSPDSQKIATSGFDGIVKLWDARTGRPLVSLTIGKGPITSVSFHPNGKWLAVATSAQGIHLWDLEKERVIRSLVGHRGSVSSVRFSPDGERVLSTSWDRSLKIWSTQSGLEEKTLRGHQGTVSSACFSPDGKWIVSSSSDRTVRVWDSTTGKELATLRGHEGVITDVRVSPDGRWIASSSLDATVKLWDAETRKLARTFEGVGVPVSRVCFSPEGRRLAVGSTTTDGKSLFQVWDVKTGKPTAEPHRFAGGVRSLCFGPEGRCLFWSCNDSAWRVEDISALSPAPTFRKSQNRIHRAEIAPGGDRIAIVEFARRGRKTHSVTVWGVESRRLLHTLAVRLEPIEDLAFSPDGERLAELAGKRVTLWDTNTGNGVLEFEGHSVPVQSVVFSPDGSRVLSAGGGSQTKGEVLVWGASDGRLHLNLELPVGDVNSVAFSPDGSRFLSTTGVPGKPGAIVVWDATDGKKLHQLSGHTRELIRAGYSRAGTRILSVAKDATVRVWDARTGSALVALDTERHDFTDAAFSPDGDRIATAGWNDGKTWLELWDAWTGVRLLRMEGHSHRITSVRFHPGGKRILTGSWDGTARFWDAVGVPESSRLSYSSRLLEESIQTAGFSEGGLYVLAKDEAGTEYAWDTKTGQRVAKPDGLTVGSRPRTELPDGRYLLFDDSSLFLGNRTSRARAGVSTKHKLERMLRFDRRRVSP